MNDNPYAPPKSRVDGPRPVLSESDPYFFAASTLKLVLMSICTGGLYELYWFYKNWVLIKQRTNQHMMPFWRAAFAPLWAYSCFKHIATAAKDRNTSAPPAIGMLAVVYFVLQAVWRLPDPYWLISFFSFVPLMPANSAARLVNRTLAGDTYDNAKFSGWNWLGLVVGGLFLVLALIGTWYPEP